MVRFSGTAGEFVDRNPKVEIAPSTSEKLTDQTPAKFFMAFGPAAIGFLINAHTNFFAIFHEFGHVIVSILQGYGARVANWTYATGTAPTLVTALAGYGGEIAFAAVFATVFKKWWVQGLTFGIAIAALPQIEGSFDATSASRYFLHWRAIYYPTMIAVIAAVWGYLPMWRLHKQANRRIVPS